MVDGCLLLVDRVSSIASIKKHAHDPLPRDFPTPSHVVVLRASYIGKLNHSSSAFI
jgi:3,4-dihydroxy-2-butanone 4-phosphate synthase